MLDSRKAPYWTIPSALRFVANARASRKTVLFGIISDYAGAGGHVTAAPPGTPFKWPIAGFHRPEFRVRREAADRRIERATLHLPDDLGGKRVSSREVVCWKERCGLKHDCQRCGDFRIPAPPPVATAVGGSNADRIAEQKAKLDALPKEREALLLMAFSPTRRD